MYCLPFLKENNLDRLPLVTFRGNRFIVFFFEAEYIMFLEEKKKEFLQTIDPKKRNRLLTAVLADLSVPFHLAGMKVLALIGKLVTGPLWPILEQLHVNIVDMNRHYQDLHQFLRQASDRITDVMDGSYVPFPQYVKKDCYYDIVLRPSAVDDHVSKILTMLFPALYHLVEKQNAAHLGLGVPDDKREELQAVPTHNKFPERVFAYVDNMLKYKPHITMLSMEAYVMFSLNKTTDWLKEKSQDDRNGLIMRAMSDAKHLRKEYQLRCQSIIALRREKLKGKIEKEMNRKLKKVEEKEKLTEEIVYFGLWQTSERVDSSLEEIDTIKEKVRALKSQLHFRQKMLEQEPSVKSLYFFTTLDEITKKRRNLTVAELSFNLKVLLNEAVHRSVPEEESCPALLVVKHVTHHFSTEGVQRSYAGLVISRVPGHPEFYNIKYDDDPNIYTYKLMEDYINGDLHINVV